MLRTILTVAVLSLSLAACAVSHKQLDNNPAFFPHVYNSSDLDISWKSEWLDNVLRIDGTITNVRSNSAYENLELEAILLDTQGTVIARKTYAVTPLRMKGTIDFKLEIPVPREKIPELIKFNYRYDIEEDRFSIKFKAKP